MKKYIRNEKQFMLHFLIITLTRIAMLTKITKRSLTFVILITVILFGSCKDFLDEEMVSTITQDYFDTEQGLDQLIVGSYNALRFKYGWQEGAYNFEMGTDIGWVGNWDWSSFNVNQWRPGAGAGDHVNNLMGIYSSSQMIGAYPGINDCNLAIEAIVSGAAQGRYASDADYAAQRLSEVYFNRAWWYYMLNTMVGDVHMSLKSSNSLPASFYFEKSSSKDVYTRLIGDLRYAFEHLPASNTEKGRHTKYSAAHFLAKLYLQRAQSAQYENSSAQHLKMLFKGNVSTDLDSCIYFASQVIESGQFALEPDYWGLFDVGIGDWSNENSREIVLAAGFGTLDANNGRYGMRSQGYFTATYVQALWGIPARSWTYGSNNTGFKPTDFAYDVFTNKIADSRFEKSFRVEYESVYVAGEAKGTAEQDYFAYNDPRNTTQTWENAGDAGYFNTNVLPGYTRESWGGRLAVPGQRKIGTGDLGLVFLENTKATAISLQEAKGQPFLLWPRWIKDGTRYYYRRSPVDRYVSTNTGLEFGGNTLPASKKHIDPNRAQTNSEYGTRNVAIFRLAETYLIRAEAFGRKYGVNDSRAIADINTVRERAAYKAGEVRAEVIARLYPGSENLLPSERQWPYTVANDNVNALRIDATYWDGASLHSVAENYPLENTTGMPDDLFRFVNFIHNEYAREMNSEYTYYEAIHHAGTQADRIRSHYQQGAPSGTGLWDAADNIVNGQGQTGTGKGSFQPFHTFRPFPQSFLDMLTDEKNVPLDPAAKAAYQNPGYN